MPPQRLFLFSSSSSGEGTGADVLPGVESRQRLQGSGDPASLYIPASPKARMRLKASPDPPRRNRRRWKRFLCGCRKDRRARLQVNYFFFFFGAVLCLFDLGGSCRHAEHPARPGLALEREGGGELQASNPFNICCAGMETTEASSRPSQAERRPGWTDRDAPARSVPVRSRPDGCGFAAGM